jgi:hypothetical protein
VTHPIRSIAIGAALLATTAAAPGAGGPREASDPAADPLALIVALGALDATDRSRIESGRPVVTMVPTRGPDLAILAVTRTEAPATRLIAWTREIEQLYRGRYMLAMGRFSTPPRIEDLSQLALEDVDLEDLRTCRTGHCGVKLSAGEIDEIRAAASAAGPRWKDAVQHAFRRAVLARAEQYLAGGLAATPGYDDRRTPAAPGPEFEAVANIGLEPFKGPAVAYFQMFPQGDATGVESVLYWSKETLGRGKPIVTITHTAIFRASSVTLPYAVVAARQVYASHYLTGSLSFMGIVGTRDDAPRYLVYAREARTDAFEGIVGRFLRGIVERRVRSDAPPVLEALRQKLETGDPPLTAPSE